MSPSDERTTTAPAPLERTLVLEAILRRLTYRDGDGHIRGRRIEDLRLETVMDNAHYRVLDTCHPIRIPEDFT